MLAKKSNTYKFSDSAKIFLWAVLAPQIFAIILIIIVGFVTNIFNLDYEIALNSVFVNLAILFLSQIAFLALFFLYNKLKRIDWVKATKIKVKINTKQIIILILIALTSLFFLSPLVGLIDHLVSLTGFSASSDLPVDLTTVSGFVLGFVALSVFPSIAEELIFRGVIYNGLLRFGYKKAIIISALLFALMHMSIQQTIYQIIIGITLAYSLYITGSLLAPIVMHFANNFTIVLLTTFALNNSIDVTQSATFTNFSDYAQVASYTAIGIFIILQLFKILKNQTKGQVADEAPVTESQAMLEERHINEPIVSQEDEENKELREQFLLKTQKAIDNKSYKTISVAIVISILLWLLDFVSNIG